MEHTFYEEKKRYLNFDIFWGTKVIFFNSITYVESCFCSPLVKTFTGSWHQQRHRVQWSPGAPALGPVSLSHADWEVSRSGRRGMFFITLLLCLGVMGLVSFIRTRGRRQCSAMKRGAFCHASRASFWFQSNWVTCPSRSLPGSKPGRVLYQPSCSKSHYCCNRAPPNCTTF